MNAKPGDLVKCIRESETCPNAPCGVVGKVFQVVSVNKDGDYVFDFHPFKMYGCLFVGARSSRFVKVNEDKKADKNIVFTTTRITEVTK